MFLLHRSKPQTQGLGVGFPRGRGPGDPLGDGLGLGVAVAVGVAVGLTVGVAVGVALGVTAGVAVGLAVGVGVGVRCVADHDLNHACAQWTSPEITVRIELDGNHLPVRQRRILRRIM